MDPRKKTVGTARACTANHRTVNTGYVVSLPKRAERNPFILGFQSSWAGNILWFAGLYLTVV